MSELAKALAAAQSEFPAIERSKTVSVQTKTGGRYSFQYAPLDMILNLVRPALTKNGLAFSQLLANVDGKPALKTMLLHSGGETLEDVCPLPINGAVSPQEFGSLLTYVRRYGLVAVLGIATEEDDDGNHASGNTSSEEPRPDGSLAGSSDYISPAAANPAARAQAAQGANGERPSQVPVHFGKNAGKTLAELTPQQVSWYANKWELRPDAPAHDVRLKQAAQALHAGSDSPDFDLPFS